MTDKFQIKKFYPCYFAFMISGSVALILGAILPYIIEETGISFAVAGSLLSVFAMGNFLASFVYPPLSKLLGRKAAFITAALLQPAGLITVTLSSDVSVLLAVFFILGISRGCNSIFNNAYVNENSDGGAAALNILHMIFAVGAFTAPVCLSGFIKAGLGWRFELYFLAAAGLLAVILLLRLKMKEALITNTGKDYSDQKKPKPFWKCSVFYVSGFLLFFYLGLENCVNGWFKTYFKVSEIMSDGFANSLVGFTWAAVLLGRLVTASLAARINPKKLVFADQSAIIRSTTKKHLLPQKFNDQKFMHKHTVIRHFSQRLFYLPYPHIDNVKQWQVTRVHKIFRYFQFDDILYEYIYLIQKFKRDFK